MSLRTKILGLFLGLMLIPMLVVSVGNYAQAMRSFRDLLDTKLGAAGDRAATTIETRARETRERLRRAAESAQLAQLFGGPGAASPPPATVARVRATLGPMLGMRFRSVEFRSAAGGVVEITGARSTATAAAGACEDLPGAPLEVVQPVVPRGETTARGELVGLLSIPSAIPAEAMRLWFGRNGQQLVVDRETGEVVFDARCAGGLGLPARPPVRDWSWDDRGAGRGMVAFREDGVEKNGTFIDLESLPLRVVTVADMEEFVGPYRGAQLLYLGFVMFIVVAAGGAFVILAQQTMGSLQELTLASERIGEGDLMPWLPPPGPDEVGRLSQSFSLMLGRLKTMMRQNEVARRLAVAGEVTAQLSHEIRNPLSSIRLNLQSLDREIREGSVPADLPQVLRLCLREINRLDEAVGSVLVLGQPKPPEFRPCHLNTVVRESLRIVAPRFRARRIEFSFEDRTECDRVLGDDGQLRGVFLNLLLNAIDAMPAGGTLRVWADCAPDGSGGIDTRVHVLDSGPGIRAEIRGLIFEPFFTTKPNGSGIGLPVAAQTVSAHGGRLFLVDDGPGDGNGAHFVVRLPAVPAGAAGGAVGAHRDRTEKGVAWRPALRGKERTEA